MHNKISGRIVKLAFLIALISMSIVHAQIQDSKKDRVYLNLDLINLKDKNFILDINDLTSDLSEEEKITSGIKYGDNELYDQDNNGIETEQGIIDFELSNAGFTWDADQSRLCARWEVYSIDSKTIDSICYGSEECCNFVGKESKREDWKEPFYLSYGMLGAEHNNIVSEQLIYVDYGFDGGKPYSNVHYSKWKSISAGFRVEGDEESKRSADIKDALYQLQKLRERSWNIREIRIENEDGNNLKSLNESNATVILTLPQNSENQGKKENDVMVSFRDFDPRNANWNKSAEINVSVSNDELKNSLEDSGIESRKIFTLHGVSDFVQGTYKGNIKVGVEGYFDTVLHCSDNTIGSCKNIKKCPEGKIDNCYERKGNELSINIPHFSSVVIGFNTSVSNLTISSPDNTSALQNGENIYLDFAVNGTVTASYSLDNGAAINLGTSNSFSALLNGNLDYGTLSNGFHTIKLTLTDNSADSKEVLHSFTVQDSKPPAITLNVTNGSSLANPLMPLKIKSDEFAIASYKLNGNSYTPSFDLGPDKEEAVSLNLLSGNNVVLINATDLSKNSIIGVFSFDYVQQSSCSDLARNGNEEGIDCGGSCPVCVSFSISTDRQIYNNGENVLLSVTSRANSVVNATITKTNEVVYQRAFFPVFSGAPISETTVVSGISGEGTYTASAVMNYFGNLETRTTQFQVLGPPVSQLSVSIDSNTTTINENGAIRFVPSVSGNISAVSYNWDFQNDRTIDSTQAEVNYSYPANGTYIVNLTVSDTNSTKSAYKLIRVRKAFAVTVLVRDNSTLGAIVGALVDFDDEEIVTNGEGKSLFSRPEDRYDLIVRKTGYRTFSNKTDLKEGQAIEVNLFEEDRQAPVISLLSPQNNTLASDSKVQFKYTATDKNAISCRLDMNFNSEGWVTKATSSFVTSGSESTFDIEGLKNGTYYWQVRCNDNQGNVNTSSSLDLYYSGSGDSAEAQAQSESLDFAATIVNLEDYDSMVLNIDDAISKLDSLSSDEKEAAEAFGLRKKLEKAKLAIQRTERDLDSLKWRKLNESGLEEEKQKILDGLKEVTSATPSQIEIIDKNEFVKYPNKEDIRKAIMVLSNQTNKKLSKSDISGLVSENFKLQSMITATTKTKILGVTYLSGQKETITLVQKMISKNKDFEGLVFWEVIPKEVAKDSSEYEFLSEKETIEEDPILQVDINKNKEFSYYIKRKVSNFDLEGIKSIVLDPNIKAKEKGFITGFLSFDNFSKEFVTGSDFRLIIEVMAIVILILVFAYYQFGGSEFLASALNPHVRKQLREFDSLKDQISHNLDLNKYDDSKPLYRELSIILTSLPKDAKVKIYPSFMDVHAKMDFVFMQKSLKGAMEIIEKDKTQAAETYMKISGLYKGLPKDYKSKVHLQCIELHNRLSQKKN